MTTYTAEQITRIGGREWTKGDMHRVYLNTDIWAPMVDLDIDRYRNGGISRAYLAGERISNARAARLTAIQVYWQDGKIWITRDAELTAQIRTAIAAQVAATEPTPATTAEAIAALRAAGRTVRQIAAAIGCAVSTVYRWARGVHRPSARYAAALAAIA